LTSPRDASRGRLYAALAAMLYGSAYVGIAFVLHSFTPLAGAVYRSLLAAAALAVVLAVQRARRPTIVDPPSAGPPRAQRLLRVGVIGLFGGAIFLVAMNLAVAHVGATIAAFVAGLYSVIAAVLAPFVLHERLKLRALVGFIVALIGTALLAELDPARTDLVGISWGLVAAVAFALFLVLSRRWSVPYRITPIENTFGAMVLASVVLIPLALIAEPASLFPQTVAVDALIALAWISFVAAAGIGLIAASVRYMPAAESAAFLLLNPITATILAALLLNERPTPVQIVGGLLVLAGMAAASLPLERVAHRWRPTPT